MKRLMIYDSEKNDISDEIELKNGRSNPFGWSAADIYWKRHIGGSVIDEKIGSHYCGNITIEAPYTYVIVEDAK